MRLGIDFGTTHTIVSCADRGNYPVVGFTDEDGDACDWFPSVVATRGGEVRYGFDALAAGPGWEVQRSFKRLLAGPGAIDAGGLVAGFLGSLRRALAERSNCPEAAGAVEVAVAVPANAHGAQRFLTLAAFRQAGFDVLSMLNEPSAAGFEYTHRHRDTLTSRRDHVVVYDLGGGTFDASLLRMDGRRHEVVETAGLSRLGGDDFDEVLCELVVAAGGGPRSAALLDRCREAKERLGPNSRKITVDADDGRTITLPVADYYAACAPLVEQTLAAMAPVMNRAGGTRRAPPDGGRSGAEPRCDELAGLYVVGGASALPPIGRALRERYGKRVHRSPYPYGAVAIGLAICADEDAGFVVEDRLSRHLGVFREHDAGRDVAFDRILGADTAHGSALTRVYRAAHNLGHYRFVECSCVDEGGTPSGDMTPLGEVLFPFDPALRGATLAQVPVRRLGQGPLVEERYAVDEMGIVQLTITDLETGYRQEHRLGGS